MSFEERRSLSAFEYLQEWRRLERRLAVLVPDDPERAQVLREIEVARRRYQELFDSLSREAGAATG